MQTWLVFGIIAFLPLMLQISLALFFVGLCFLTAAVDHTAGITSFSLVAAWAFFVCITTIMPLFFPRCPYKIPFFEWLFRDSLKGIRKLVSDPFLRWTAVDMEVPRGPIAKTSGR